MNKKFRISQISPISLIRRIRQIRLPRFPRLPRKVRGYLLGFSVLLLVNLSLLLAYRLLSTKNSAIAAWFDDTWGYRQKVAVTNAGSAQTDFQVAITLNTSALISAGKMQSDCDDIRVTDLNGKILPYWLAGCNTTTTKIWPKVPSLPTTGATVYLYYGNPSAVAGKTKIGTQTYPGLSCKSILDTGDSAGIGTYWIDPTNGNTSDAFQAYCDMTNDSGGWMLVTSNMIQSETNSYTSNAKTTDANGGLINTVTITGAMDCSSKYYLMMLKDTIPWTKIRADYEFYGGNSCWGVFGNAASGISSNLITYQAGTDTIRNQVKMGGSAGNNFDNTTARCDNETTNFWHSNQGNVTRSAQTVLRRNSMSSYAGLSNGVACTGYTDGWKYQNIYIHEDSMEPTGITVASPASEEKSQGPVAYWKFDEGNGITTNNSGNGGSSLNGTISGATWQSEDQCISGKCLKFDGVNNYVNFPQVSSFKTISLWAKIQSGSLLTSNKWNATPDYYMFYDAGNIKVTQNASPYTPLSAPIDLNKWTHITLICSAGEKNSLYLNGQLVNQLSYNNVIDCSQLLLGRNHVGSDYFRGFIDDVKVYNYARTAAQIKADYNSKGATKGTSVQIGSKDPRESFSQGLVGYWKLDESASPAVDSSGNGANLTLGGSNTFVSGKYGNALNNPGSGVGASYTYSAGSGLDFTSISKPTISFWLKNSTSNQTSRFIEATTAGGWGLEIISGDLRINTYGGSTGSFSHTITTDGLWHHYAITYDGSNAKLYKDSVLTSTIAYSAGWTSGSKTLYVMGDPSYPTTGVLEDLRIYNRALSPKEVRDLYAWAPGPNIYLPLDEGTGTTVYDKSGNNWTITTSGTPTWTVGKFGKAANLNGSSYFSTSYFDYTKAFTQSAWIFLDSLTGVDQGVFGQCESYAVSKCMHDTLRNSQPYLGFYGNDMGSSTNLVTGRWYFITYVYDGANKIMYLDGNMIAGPTASSPYNGLSGNTIFGAELAGSSSLLGKIDEIKVYNYARTSKQITEDMNGGHPAGGSPVGSQQLYWKMDEGYGTSLKDSSLQNITGTFSCFGTACSNPTWSNQGKFSKALYFSGSGATGSFVTASPINLSSTTGSQITISTWMKPETIQNGSGWYVRNGAGMDENYGVNLASSPTGGLFPVGITWYDGTWRSLTTTGYYVPQNMWSQVTVIISQGQWLKIYVNGAFKEQVNWIGSNSVQSTSSFNIGGHSGTTGQMFNGYLDEFKIYNSALTEDEIKLDYSRGSAMVLGTMGSNTSYEKQAANQEYCVPGGADLCPPPVGEWKFEEGTGGSANDTSGNNRTGTLTSGPTWITGKVGKALYLDGDDYVSLTRFTYGGAGVTMSAWVKTSSSDSGKNYDGNAAQNVIGDTTGGVGVGFGLTGGKIQFCNYTTIWECVTGLTNANDNNWHYITAIHDTNGAVSLYLDGRLDNTGTISYGGEGVDVLGRGYGGDYFTGLIDYVRIFNYARTAAQIAYDYNRGAPVAHWKFNECQGVVANDSGGLGGLGQTREQSRLGLREAKAPLEHAQQVELLGVMEQPANITPV